MGASARGATAAVSRGASADYKLRTAQLAAEAERKAAKLSKADKPYKMRAMEDTAEGKAKGLEGGGGAARAGPGAGALPHAIASDRAFLAGDVWRGTLTSCHQTQYHTKRRYRYFPVELSDKNPWYQLMMCLWYLL